jgi:hypothetical protein
MLVNRSVVVNPTALAALARGVIMSADDQDKVYRVLLWLAMFQWNRQTSAETSVMPCDGVWAIRDSRCFGKSNLELAQHASTLVNTISSGTDSC